MLRYVRDRVPGGSGRSSPSSDHGMKPYMENEEGEQSGKGLRGQIALNIPRKAFNPVSTRRFQHERPPAPARGQKRRLPAQRLRGRLSPETLPPAPASGPTAGCLLTGERSAGPTTSYRHRGARPGRR